MTPSSKLPALLSRRAILIAALGAFAVNGPALADASSSTRCEATGGQQSIYYYFVNTNEAPIHWQRHGGSSHPMCVYTDAVDGSRIALFTTTLRSHRPTLAAQAYYSRLPFDSSEWDALSNPSYLYCTQLGGAIAGPLLAGINGAGWARWRGDQVFSMCVFADGSSIDSWGLMYISDGSIRGIDLGTVLAYPDPYAEEEPAPQTLLFSDDLEEE